MGDALPDLNTCVQDEEKVAEARTGSLVAERAKQADVTLTIAPGTSFCMLVQDAAALATAFKAEQGDDVKKALGDLAQALATAFAPCQAADNEMTRLMAALAAMQHPLAFSFQAVRPAEPLGPLSTSDVAP